MDSTDPDIVFDTNGQCNNCADFIDSIEIPTQNQPSNRHQLEQIVSKIKSVGAKNKYDCIVGISGGIDSCYSAYICKTLGLKPLLLHLDNGWDSEIAVRNIKAVADKLGFDYESYVLDWEEFKQIQLAFLRSSIVDLDIPTDLAIPATLFITAAKHNVKYIISGGNFTSEGILPRQWGYHVMKDMKLYNHIVSNYGTIKRKKTPAFGIIREFHYRFVKGIKTIYLLNYIDYNKDEARSYLESELGWKYYGGKHYESRFTGFWQSYILPTKFEIDYRKATFSTQICSGQMTREEAIELLKEPAYDLQKLDVDKHYFCKKLGIHIHEFDEIMKEDPKTYKDFPNAEGFIDWVFNTYRKLFPNKRL